MQVSSQLHTSTVCPLETRPWCPLARIFGGGCNRTLLPLLFYVYESLPLGMTCNSSVTYRKCILCSTIAKAEILLSSYWPNLDKAVAFKQLLCQIWITQCSSTGVCPVRGQITFWSSPWLITFFKDRSGRVSMDISMYSSFACRHLLVSEEYYQSGSIV
jgi:hypothetical protein